MKQEFKKIYESLNLQPHSNDDQSSISNIFRDPNFLEGLESCKNPYDLVESFPLKGLNLKINKSNVISCEASNIKLTKIYSVDPNVDQPAVIKNNGAVIVNDGDNK